MDSKNDRYAAHCLVKPPEEPHEEHSFPRFDRKFLVLLILFCVGSMALILGASLAPTTAQACSCSPIEPSLESMCQSDHVSKVLLKSGPRPAGKFQVEFDTELLINYLFHNSDAFINGSVLTTPLGTAACGMTLTLREETNENTYLIGGPINSDGQFYVDICKAMVLRWSKLDPEDRHFLNDGQLRDLCVTKF